MRRLYEFQLNFQIIYGVVPFRKSRNLKNFTVIIYEVFRTFCILGM